MTRLHHYIAYRDYAESPVAYTIRDGQCPYAVGARLLKCFRRDVIVRYRVTSLEVRHG